MLTARSVCVLAIVLVMLGKKADGAESVTVDAAVDYDRHRLYLLSGTTVLRLNENGEYHKSSFEQFGIPGDGDLSAASTALDYSVMFFYEPEGYYNVSMRTGKATFYEYSEDLENFLDGEGPDAVAWRDGREFYFKGCRLATTDRVNGEFRTRKASNLGIPCDLDAAWNSDDKKSIIMLKGDQLWFWNARDYVDGPEAFSDHYSITSWELTPSE